MEVYCHLIDNTGHTWEQIDLQWDIPRLLGWNRHIGHFPPLNVLVAKYLGYKAPADPADVSKLTTEQHAERLLGALGVIT